MHSKTAYLHFSRFPSPVNPIFFGQTFVINNLTAASAAHGDKNSQNIVFTRNKGHNPLDEHLMGETAQRLSKQRFNAELVRGYDLDSVGTVIKIIEDLARDGVRSMMVFHYPVSSDTELASKLRDALRARGLEKDAGIVFYLHTQADNIVHNNGDEIFKRYHESMMHASDGLIAVSDAVKGTFNSIDPSCGSLCSVVRNGINPHIYNVSGRDEVIKARAEMGLNPNVETVVSFSGRLDKIKGSDFLLRTMEHFEMSRDPRDSKTAFVVATPHILNFDQASRHFKMMCGLKRLILEDRLKIVLDISKYTRGEDAFRSDVASMITAYAMGFGFEKFASSDIFGGFVNKPVQSISDIYLHPSRSEGMPLAVLEALFAGAHVIATPVGGIPEAVNTPELGTLIDLPHEIKTAGSQLASTVEKATKEFVGAIISTIRAQSGRERDYDRATVSDHLQSYTDYNMFAAFEGAVSKMKRWDV